MPGVGIAIWTSPASGRWYGWPEGAIQQSYQLKCRSWLEHGDAPAADDPRISAALERGDQVVVMSGRAELPEFMAGWRRVELPGRLARRLPVAVGPPYSPMNWVIS